MADLRAEQILAQVLTNLTGLTTTGTKVKRGRVYPIEEDTAAALSIYMGDDEPLSKLVQDITDWELQVIVKATVKTTATVETTLNQIRKEVHIAMMADTKQSLPAFVIDTNAGQAAQPEIDNGDQAIATQEFEYLVHYRTSRADLSA